jgi:hypothetical protein
MFGHGVACTRRESPCRFAASSDQRRAVFRRGMGPPLLQAEEGRERSAGAGSFRLPFAFDSTEAPASPFGDGERSDPTHAAIFDAILDADRARARPHAGPRTCDRPPADARQGRGDPVA